MLEKHKIKTVVAKFKYNFDSLNFEGLVTLIGFDSYWYFN